LISPLIRLTCSPGHAFVISNGRSAKLDRNPIPDGPTTARNVLASERLMEDRNSIGKNDRQEGNVSFLG
jgi:hypothetical protein